MSNETPGLARLSMSLPADLFRQLDMMVEERGLPSRSQLIAELIRHSLAEHEAYTRPDEMLAGTITLVYRGDRGRVRHQLAQTQAEYLKEVISSQHVFLEDDQSLERTVTLAQRHDPAPPVAENLHLDMAGAADIAFEEDARVAEIALSLARNGGEAFAHRCLIFAHAHANAAAPGRGLEDHGETCLLYTSPSPRD